MRVEERIIRVINQSAKRSTKNLKGWVIYSLLVGFTSGYFTASFVIADTYKGEVRKSLESLQGNAREGSTWDIYEIVEPAYQELPPPYDF